MTRRIQRELFISLEWKKTTKYVTQDKTDNDINNNVVKTEIGEVYRTTNIIKNIEFCQPFSNVENCSNSKNDNKLSHISLTNCIAYCMSICMLTTYTQTRVYVKEETS